VLQLLTYNQAHIKRATESQLVMMHVIDFNKPKERGLQSVANKTW